MNGPKKLWVAAVATVAVGLGAGVALVAAHTHADPTTVEISSTSTGMTGALVGIADSSNSECFTDRKIQFLRDRENGKDKVLGSEPTNGSGLAFRDFPNGLKIGQYYTRAKRLVLKNSKHHKHTCGKDASDPGGYFFPDPNP